MIIKEKTKLVFKFFIGVIIFTSVLVSLFLVSYLKLLPYFVSNQKVISYFEKICSKALAVEVLIDKPVLKTSLAPKIEFSVENVKLQDKNGSLFEVQDCGVSVSLAKLRQKNIVIDNLDASYLFLDTSRILNLPLLKSTPLNTKSDWNIDVFQSLMNVKRIVVLYDIDKKTKANLDVKNLSISNDVAQKYISYDIVANIIKGKNKLHITTSDCGQVYIENKNKIVVKKSDIRINNSLITLAGEVDNSSNYNVRVKANDFKIPEVIALLDSQIIENNLAEQFVYFKDINGKFDFKVNATNEGMGGNVLVRDLSFKLVPFMDLPIKVTKGMLSFDDKNIKIKDFKGFYNGKSANKIEVDGSVNDYLKSVDMNIVGKSVATNDFTTNYLSKMLGYPIRMKGHADTKVVLKSKYNKFDLTWLYLFKKGNGFLIDDENFFMNDSASRLLVGKFHFEDMFLNIKSLNYYAGNPEDDRAEIKIPILSFHGDVDFSNGETFLKRFGLELKKPMPTGLVNMLIKQPLFKGGTFIGHLDVLNKKGYPPKIKGDIKVDKVRIPSQRLFIKEATLATDKENVHIAANGRYRRSEYLFNGTIVNELKLPIVVNNITLSLDSIDVEKYLKMFNAMQPTEASSDISMTVSQSVQNNNDDEDNDDEKPTFDLANLIIKECVLKVKKGFYKDIHFSDVVATLSLDKNSILTINSNKFDFAEGETLAKINCDLKNHKYSIWLGLIKVNSDLIATNLLNLSREIQGKASGLIELNTDNSLKLNGRIQFRVYEGVIGKVGLVEYIMKVASLFRNPLTMVSPSVISDLVNIPEGKFDQIDGDLKIKDNVIIPMMIKSSAPQLSSYIVGTYNLETQDAALRIYTMFSTRRKGLYGVFRNLSLNSLANRIPMSSRNDSEYYSSEIANLPPIDAKEQDCQIFLTKVDGDIEHNNFISSLKKLK